MPRFEAWAPGRGGEQEFQTPTSGTAPNGLPYFNWDQGALQLNREGWSWAAAPGTPVTITYAFRDIGTPPANMGVSGFQPFNAIQMQVAEQMLARWSEVANITFQRVGGSGYSNDATILFGNFVNGPAQFSAFAYLPQPGATASGLANGDVWVNVSRDYDANPLALPRGAQILLHEIGHTLGLLHPSVYDGGAQSGVTYNADADFWQDTRQFTVQSYFVETHTGGSYGEYWVTAPQMFDIAAAQYLYGANMTTRTGDTVYGFNSNTGISTFSLNTSMEAAIFCIWDAGGVDTLDLSGYNTNSEIDLRPESFSSAGSHSFGDMVGNISIARGVTIENAIAGGGFDVIIGNDAINALSGNAGNDTIYGGGGNDLLDGGADADAMSGGLGDDAFIVDNASDTAAEGAGEGHDTVYASVTFSLWLNVEDLTLTGVGAIIGYGNAHNNTLLGNAAANALYGFDGADILDGGAGADNMFGGNGDDAYYVDNAGDQTTEVSALGGTDIVYSSVARNLTAHIENLTLFGSGNIAGSGNTLNNIIIGNSGANTLYGFEGNDRLDGDTGADTMFGAAGDDVYVVDNAGDITVEGISGPAGGIDTIETFISRNMNANFENMILLGSATIAYGNVLGNVLTGNGLANSLYGFEGNDTLDGGAGADSMFGADGDDTYIVDNAGDVTSEVSALGGTDTVISSVERNLTANLENLTLSGSANINGAGNALNNIITGNSGVNTLFGLAGDDTLDGGLGADTLQGGANADTYAFTTALGGGNVDAIVGFSIADDTIYLNNAVFTGLATGALAAGAFVIGAAAADADDRIIYNSATGQLFFDADGNDVGAAVLFATLTAGLSLTSADFIVGGP